MKGLASSLDDLAKVSERFKSLNQYANPSGTAQSGITGALGAGLITAPTSTLTGVVGSRILSSALAKPVTAKKIAKWASAYETAATKPSVASNSLLTAQSKVLALELAKEAGDAGLYNQILPGLSVRSVPAEDNSEDQGVNEVGNGSVGKQPRLVQ